MPVDNFKSLQAYSVGLRQEAILVGGKVVHLKVGSFASNLHGAFDHAKAVLGSYTEKKNVREGDKGGVEGEGEAGFAQYAQKLEDHLTEALTMVYRLMNLQTQSTELCTPAQAVWTASTGWTLACSNE